MKVFIRAKEERYVPQVALLHTFSDAIISDEDSQTVIADLPEEVISRLREDANFEVYDDIQFHLAAETWWERQLTPQPQTAVPPVWMTRTQADVMQHNKAAQAWAQTRGAGVTIAIVDTGLDANMPDFPHRSPHSFTLSYETPYADTVGHGTMCSAIACGNTTQGGRYEGVAPDATLLTVRTNLRATDLYPSYERLLRLKRNGEFPGGLVVSNSYALYICDPPNFPKGHPYLSMVRDCIAAGIVFVFAAGNNHSFGLCQHDAAADSPNTIWAVNSIDEVITVGTVNWDDSNCAGGEHSNSSRGPGQWSDRQDKPDVVAPTYGDVACGGGYRNMEWWGTSGACPQVAGLAALLLSRNPLLNPEDIRLIIRKHARALPAISSRCVGAGLIDCQAAVASL